MGYSAWGPRELDMTERLVFIFGCAGSLLPHGLFSSCGKQVLLFLTVRQLLIAVASLIVDTGSRAHRLH